MVRPDAPKISLRQEEPHIANAPNLSAGDPVSDHQNSPTASPRDLLSQD
jgi:hypothetical protein